MPVRSIAGTDLGYALVIFDDKGDERPEPDGTFLSETLAQRVADPARPVTDVFFTAHGWQGDVPAAIVQFDRWIAAAPQGARPSMPGPHASPTRRAREPRSAPSSTGRDGRPARQRLRRPSSPLT